MAAPVLDFIRPIDKVIAEMNREFSVLQWGGNVGILHERLSADGVRTFDMLTSNGFKLLNAPDVVRTDEGKTHGVADVWLKHPQRKTYRGICFRPGEEAPHGYYNLWDGFGVDPDPRASCQRLLDHVYENVCCGDETRYAWAMGWFAQIVQQPRHKQGTSLALIGLQGTGKTIAGTAMGRLFGRHYVSVSTPRYITGQFNGHLSDKLVVQAEESFWAGDHTAEGRLKDLVTGTHQQIEFKGREPLTLENYVRLFITSNQDWVVPAALDQRRFAVYEIADTRKNDHAYFAAIIKELENGGYGALLHHLQTYDLSGINLRVPPETSALLKQKLASLDNEGTWYLDLLTTGKLPGRLPFESEDTCVVADLYEHYTAQSSKRSRARLLSLHSFGHFMRKILPSRGELRVRKTIPGRGREWCYAFPRLSECRQAFERMAQHPIEWPPESEVTEWE